MKKIVLFLPLVLILTGCSTETSSTSSANSQTLQLLVPSDCNQQGVIDSFDREVPGSQYVPTQWQPAPGTDLAAAYDNGGIACSYGIQVAEIGGTILWASNKDGVWNKRVTDWEKAGLLKIDLPNLDETDAYILKEGSTSADEMHVWAINVLIGGIWIQVGATFLQTVEEALPIIEAAIDAASQA